MTVCFAKYLVFSGICAQLTVEGLSSGEFIQENCMPENNITLVCNYLPKSISRGYIRVKIFEVGKDFKYVAFDIATFEDSSWDQIDRIEIQDSIDVMYNGLQFGSKCFSGLTSLLELRINVQKYHFDADDVFAGLPLLHTLDLSGSYKLYFNELQRQLICSGCLPNLKTLKLSRIGIDMPQEIRMDLNFFRGLSSRNITYLDISGMHIDFLNLTALRQELPFLKHINASYSQLGKIEKKIRLKRVSDLEYLDVSYINVPPSRLRIFPGKMTFSNLKIKPNIEDLSYLFEFGRIKMVNASGIISKAGPLSSVWIHNNTVSFDETLNNFSNDANTNLDIETIIFSNNRIKYADIRMTCNIYKSKTLKLLDISGNGLELLHPSITSCTPNLESLDLSRNDIYRMFIYNVEQSVELVANVKNLRNINLSQNNITVVPYQLFTNNYKLESIDLSNNRLENVHFDLQHLRNLKMIDISKNNIHYLDDTSLTILESVSIVIEIYMNPLDCSVCATRRFVTWLLKIKSISVSNFNCSNEYGLVVRVDDDALSDNNNICARKSRIIAASVSAGFVVLVVVLSVYVFYKYKKKTQIEKQRNIVINKLREGNGKYEFVAFLSFPPS
jgi:Leucine-rich repeat (LRR) protein